MLTPRTLIAAFASLGSIAFMPALASAAETVEVQVDLDAPAAEMYDAIREQAWTACKPDSGSRYAPARRKARRVCQKAVIADVIAQLPSDELVRLAERDGIRSKS